MELLNMPQEVKLDFKKKREVFHKDDDIFATMDDDSSDEDVLATIEKSVDDTMLASPEYQSFADLGAKMVECVCPSGGVRILVIEEGDGPLVSLDSEVTFHYAGYWEGASIPFDCSLTTKTGAPLRQRVGTDMLPGLAIGFLNVHGPSARFQLLLAPHVAFMECGAPPRIRRAEHVLFVITLYDVRTLHAAAAFNDLPREEQAKFDVAINAIKDIRVDGKRLFEKQKYKRAIKSYEQAISIINLTRPETEQQEEEIKNIKIKIFVNLAVCYCKIDKPKYVITMCENIDKYIDINTHCKALFYYGKAHEMLGKTDDAIIYYKRALKLEPKNKDIGKTLADLDERMKKSALNERAMWQKAFDTNVEEKVVYDVDEEFKKSVIDMCQDLAGNEDFAKFDLPSGFTRDEIECLKSLTSQFEGLTVFEEGQGTRKKISIIKKQT
ncbi:inactive peptidyl-prolyl cis-trans isomerase shutdown-like isoform X2 [Anticarsia gemmatalis]|uniref:inactive peptidyl-prolyl cis-trans isomerase shutdown-like isoform X2 n=1 Tax=Anticarsia gemmatalis TaxID=129554 RepID=UPI003F768046